MVAWPWLILVGWIGASAGVLISALCFASRMSDEKNEKISNVRYYL